MDATTLLQQRVVEAVLALEPPYRDVILLRFCEELPPREVAAQLDIPVNTVRTQTRRAIEQLRGVFDRKYGGRAAWSAAIGGLFFAQAATATGVSKLLVAALLLAVTGATGTLWHSSTREERIPPRRGESHAEGTGGPAAATQTDEPAAAATVTEAPRPTHFRGRIFPFGTGLQVPLAGANVYLAAASKPPWLATAVTDDDGRFAFPWKSGWKSKSAFLLYVEHKELWSDPIYLHDDGFQDGDGFVVRVELNDNPRFQFVLGAGRRGIVGARVTIFEPSAHGRMELGAQLGNATTDANGCAQPQWPSWASSAIVRVQRPGGDTLQWRMDLMQARTYDPYDMALDEEEIATVRMQVVDRNGNPACGVRVFADGSWAPDGLSGGGYFANGAEPVPLVGVTDKQGIATFRFPADRARHGIYLPRRMVAFGLKGGLPQFAEWTPSPRRSQEDEGARSGSTLPILRFGTTPPGRAMFAIRGDDPDLEYDAYWRGGDGRVRGVELDIESEIRVDGFTLCRLRNGGRGELGVVVYDGDRVGWAKLDEAQLGRCMRGEAVVEVCAAQETRDLTIRFPAGMQDDEFRLEAVEVPFVFGDSVEPGGESTLALPAIPGKWRVLFGREGTDAYLIEAKAGSTITLRSPRD